MLKLAFAIAVIGLCVFALFPSGIMSALGWQDSEPCIRDTDTGEMVEMEYKGITVYVDRGYFETCEPEQGIYSNRDELELQAVLDGIVADKEAKRNEIIESKIRKDEEIKGLVGG